MKISSVFISEPINVGWIIEKLMRDIATELRVRGIRVTIGNAKQYDHEEVVFHSRYLYATPLSRAKVNSLFVTHVDDRLKEVELKNSFNKFNSFVCCSQHDAELLAGLGCRESMILGNDLPHRGGIFRPKKVAMFSERYSDGRKNENWLLEYFALASAAARKSIILCLIGYNWEVYCKKLADMGLSFELYRYDRSLSGEYEIQKSILSDMDYLIYPGFDGGAMCVYDAIFAGKKLIVADNGYHRGINGDTLLFSSKTDFFSCLDEIVESVRQREEILHQRSIERYVDNLMNHWQMTISGNIEFKDADLHAIDSQKPKNIEAADLNFLRSHYKKISARRFASSIYRSFIKLFKSQK